MAVSAGHEQQRVLVAVSATRTPKGWYKLFRGRGPPAPLGSCADHVPGRRECQNTPPVVTGKAVLEPGCGDAAATPRDWSWCDGCG